jgi:hypothetical protein
LIVDIALARGSCGAGIRSAQPSRALHAPKSHAKLAKRVLKHNVSEKRAKLGNLREMGVCKGVRRETFRGRVAANRSKRLLQNLE